LAHFRSLEDKNSFKSDWWERYRTVSRDDLRNWSNLEGEPFVSLEAYKELSKIKKNKKRRRPTELELSEALKGLEERLWEKFGSNTQIQFKQVKIGDDTGDTGDCIYVNIYCLGSDAFAMQVRSELIREYINSVLFAHETEVGVTDTKDRFSRIECVDLPAVFSLAGGLRVLEAVKITETGKQILEWVQTILDVEDEMVQEFLKERGLTEEVEYIKFKPNLLQITVSLGKGYKTHSDRGAEQCAQNVLDSGVILPTWFEQRVVTLAYTFPMEEKENEKEDVKNTDGHCHLKHFCNNTGNLVSQVVTKEQSVHIQGFGAQKYLKHGVTVLKGNTSEPQRKRVVISCRYVLPLTTSENIKHVYGTINNDRESKGHGSFDIGMISRVKDT
jgi:hypothetical protein